MSTFPQTVESHGNAKVASEYVRTHPVVMSKIVKAVKDDKKSVLKAYNDLKNADDDDLMRPRNKQQVWTVSPVTILSLRWWYVDLLSYMS